MKKYLLVAVALFFNNEIVSTIALTVMGVMLLIDVVSEAEREGKSL